MIKKLTISNPVFIRNFCSEETLTSKCLKYSKFGEPADVLEIIEEKVNSPKNDEVVIKVLGAPINPSDINTIQGKYPVKPKFPAIGGNECVGEIHSIGPNVKKLKVGDRVIVSKSGLGTWRTIATFKEKDLMQVSNKLGIPEAAMLSVNPCTAYRLLRDFVQLEPGQSVIQNGANSAVGQVVHQLCKAWDINSIGIIRDREDVCKLKTYLESLGATGVLIEDNVRGTNIFHEKSILKPHLGLNCIGGKNATALTFHLKNKSTLVTYGGMSRKPLNIPTGLLIFRDISFRGFWLTQWIKDNYTNPERQKMFDELVELFNCGLLKASINELVPLDNYKEAVEKSLNLTGFTGKKYILEMNKVDKS